MGPCRIGTGQCQLRFTYSLKARLAFDLLIKIDN